MRDTRNGLHLGHHRLLVFKPECHSILLAEDPSTGAHRHAPTLVPAALDRLMATFTSEH
jgi:hypothetical protein